MHDVDAIRLRSIELDQFACLGAGVRHEAGGRGHDLLIVDSRTFLPRLVDAGVDAKLYEYEGAPHVFMAILPTREAKDALRLLKDFVAT